LSKDVKLNDAGREKTMTIQIDLHGRAMLLRQRLSRAALSAHLRARPRFPRRLVRALLRTGEQGSALVEFALILPMLMLLTTGVLVFGVAMNNYIQLTNAVSIGARTLAVSAQLTTDPCATAYTAITNAAPNLNSSNFTFTYVLNGTTYTGATCNSSSVSTGAAGNLSSGATATVTATYPLNLSVYGKVFSKNGAVLSSTSTELVQ
jgi:Flp pilus assembly protein TadG